MRSALLLLPLLAASQAQADTLPSGQPFALWQISWERMDTGRDLQLVIRGLAPEIATRGFDVAQGDMDWICATHGAAIAGLPFGGATRVVIELAERPVVRGVSSPDVTQFFGLYALEDGVCQWEDF